MNAMRLALKMLWRDLRSGELLLLGMAIVLAVASLTSVGFLADRVARGLNVEAGQLLGGDLLLSSDRPWAGPVADEAQTRGLAMSRTVLFTSMASTAERAVLAGVKVVDDAYPLRGSVRVADAPGQPDRVAAAMPAPGEIWLDERLIAQLGVATGDAIGLGLIELTVRAVVTFESDRGANFFSLLPRLIINEADLAATGLLVEGARARYRLHLAGPAPAVTAFEGWAAPLLERGQRIERIDNARPEVRAALDQAERFLRLAALLAVILAAVAVGLSSRRYLLRHLDGCAVMRCLGAQQAQINRLFALEFLAFALAAAAVGCVLGVAVHGALATLLAGVVQTALPAPSWWPVAHGLAVGVVLVLGFSMPQLLRLAKVPTLRVFRRELGSPVAAISTLGWVAGLVALGAIILWIAADAALALRVGGGFLVAFAGFAAVSWLVLRTLARVRGLGRSRHAGRGWRYGFAAIGRRLSGSVLQATALGVGLTALLLLTLIRADLLEAWRSSTPADAPNRFVLNIQPEQRAGVQAFFRDAGLPQPQLAPMIRGRLIAVNDAPVDTDGYDSARARRLADRAFNLTYGADLQVGNEVVEGQWHGASRVPQFSIEAGVAEELGLALGDVVAFEVAGMRVEAPITSVRKLRWDSMRTNFFFVASPGVLDQYPASLISSFYLPPDQQQFTVALIERFPNLSVIDVAAVIAQVETIMNKVIAVVQFVFGFALLAGLVVLFAALQSTHDERGHELALLRTLGARNRQLREALLAEFAVLGAVAGVLSAVGAGTLGWVLATQLFELDYLPAWQPLLASVLGGVALLMAGGWLGVRGLMHRPPLASLQAQG